MSLLPINEGRSWSPYFVFIRRTGFEHEELLQLLGLSEYAEKHNIELNDTYLCIGEDSEWTHLADDWGYTHWHSTDFKEKVREIALSHTVFTFSYGDSDMFFDLEFHSEGKLRRQFVWIDPDYSGGHLEREIGDALPMEDSIPRGSDPIDALWNVTRALGIETDYSRLEMRAYGPSSPMKKKGWSLTHSINNFFKT